MVAIGRVLDRLVLPHSLEQSADHAPNVGADLCLRTQVRGIVLSKPTDPRRIEEPFEVGDAKLSQ